MIRTRVGRQPRLNPFATRFVAPGAMPYRFADPNGLIELVRKLEVANGWGEIVGPHGSGKSTLIASLLPLLDVWHVRPIRLSTSDRKLPRWVWDEPTPRTLLVIDGFEQLTFFTRIRLKRHCRRFAAGLLVTSHRPMGLPELYDTRVTTATAKRVIADLVPIGAEWVVKEFDVSARLRFHRGSLREVLFELYDRWEAGNAENC